MSELDIRQLKKQAKERILRSEPTLAEAFISRRFDGVFAAVGREVSKKPLDHLQQVWLGWEWLSDSLYLDI